MRRGLSDWFAFMLVSGILIRTRSAYWGSRRVVTWLPPPVFTLTSAYTQAWTRPTKRAARPDFAVALYPGHLTVKEGTLELNPDIATRISSQTPPTFLLQNENDDVDSIWDALSYEAALINAHVPVEFHSYAEGGHAFGLRRTNYPATAWPLLVETWLRTIGMLPN